MITIKRRDSRGYIKNVMSSAQCTIHSSHTKIHSVILYTIALVSNLKHKNKEKKHLFFIKNLKKGKKREPQLTRTYTSFFFKKRSHRDSWPVPQRPETVLLLDGHTQRLTRLVKIMAQLGLQHDRRPAVRDRYFRLTPRAPKADDHQLYSDQRLAKADHSFTGQVRMDMLSPDGIMKLTIDTLDDSAAAGLYPAIKTRCFYYELIERPSEDLIREIESEYHVNWTSILVNEFGDGRNRLYSIIQMRDIVRWPALIGNWRRETTRSDSNNTAATIRSSLPAPNHIGSNKNGPFTAPPGKMPRTFATSTQKSTHTSGSEERSPASVSNPTPPPSTGSDTAVDEPKTKRALDTSWSPSPIAKQAPLFNDDDDEFFAMIDETTAATGAVTVPAAIPVTETGVTTAMNNRERDKPKCGAKRSPYFANNEDESAEFPFSQKRQKTSDTPMVEIPITTRIVQNIRAIEGETAESLAKPASHSTTKPTRVVEEPALTDPEEEFMEASLRLDRANWASTLLFGKREPKNRKVIDPPPTRAENEPTDTVETIEASNTATTEPRQQINVPKAESWATADAEYGGSDVETVDPDDESFEIVDERGPTIEEFLETVNKKVNHKSTAEREAELAEATAERNAFKNACERETREAQKELEKAAKRLTLKKALKNCERLNSADGSSMPPPFETTGLSRYVINAGHRDYTYIMHRVTGQVEPNLYMRRQLSNGNGSQHGYYTLTTDMDLLEAAKKTEKGAVAIRIPSPNNDEEVLFFIRIVEPHKVSDYVYKQWGQATRQERIERDKLPGQRFYLTVHVEPTIDLMIDPVEIDIHTKFQQAVRRQLSDPDRAIKSDQMTDLSKTGSQRPANRLSLASRKPLDLVYTDSKTNNHSGRPQQPTPIHSQSKVQRPTTARPTNGKNTPQIGRTQARKR